MIHETKWIVVLAQADTGKRDTRAVWAPDKGAAIKQALKDDPDMTWTPVHAVQMTVEDEEAIADMEWWNDADDEREVELDREQERFDTFRRG
jgi:hypothetical protein